MSRGTAAVPVCAGDEQWLLARPVSYNKLRGPTGQQHRDRHLSTSNALNCFGYSCFVVVVAIGQFLQYLIIIMGRQRDEHVFFYRSAMYYYAKRLRSVIRRRAIVEHGYSDQLCMSVCLCLMLGSSTMVGRLA